MSNKIGFFSVTPIMGLDYETRTFSGRTGEKGCFQYADGETVTFSIGSLVLGSAIAKERMTPADLSNEVGGDIRRVCNRRVTNICRVLLSLNSGKNIEEGIVITDEIRQICSKYVTLNFNQPEDMFENNPQLQEFYKVLHPISFQSLY